MKPSNKENLDGLEIDKNVAPGRLRDLFQRFMPSSRFREIFWFWTVSSQKNITFCTRDEAVHDSVICCIEDSIQYLTHKKSLILVSMENTVKKEVV